MTASSTTSANHLTKLSFSINGIIDYYIKQEQREIKNFRNSHFQSSTSVDTKRNVHTSIIMLLHTLKLFPTTYTVYKTGNHVRIPYTYTHRQVLFRYIESYKEMNNIFMSVHNYLSQNISQLVEEFDRTIRHNIYLTQLNIDITQYIDRLRSYERHINECLEQCCTEVDRSIVNEMATEIINNMISANVKTNQNNSSKQRKSSDLW